MMQPPPVRITGNPFIDWAVLACSFITVLYFLKAIRLARDTARQVLRLFIAGVVLGLVFYLSRGRLGGDTPQADGIAFGILALLFLPRRKRSRHIPAKIKCEVIARGLKSGEKYNPQKHHIDHKWAFSRGGGHTLDNLRLIEKEQNLRKGAKRPGVWDMFFR